MEWQWQFAWDGSCRWDSWDEGGEEEGEEGEYEGEGTSTVASLVSERSESGSQALVPAPVRPGGEKLAGFRGPGLGKETSGISSLDSLF